MAFAIAIPAALAMLTALPTAPCGLGVTFGIAEPAAVATALIRPTAAHEAAFIVVFAAH
jgi:hypothetical protein